MSHAKTTKKDHDSNYSFNPQVNTLYTENAHAKTFIFRIDGIPRPQARGYPVSKGKGAKKSMHIFSPSRKLQQSFHAAVQAAIAANCPSFLSATSASLSPLSPVNVDITLKYIFPRHKRHYSFDESSGKYILQPSAPIFKEGTPDIDNLVKLSLDAMQGVCFPNDQSVVSLKATKVFDKTQTTFHEDQKNSGYTIVKIVAILDGNITQSGCTCAACLNK